MEVAIIKYNAGNIRSVLFALERIGVKGNVTDDPVSIQSADKVIFPGVGEASTAMAYLQQRELDKLIIALQQPVLGICLGMQLLCEFSEENATACLGIFNTRVKKFTGSLKIPQIGWNKAQDVSGPLFAGIDTELYCYFLHSYYAELSGTTVATTEYGLTFSSALQKNNFYGVQFHPEKSSKAGEQVLKNFLAL